MVASLIGRGPVGLLRRSICEQAGERVSFSPGEKAGMRAGVTTILRLLQQALINTRLQPGVMRARKSQPLQRFPARVEAVETAGVHIVPVTPS